MAKRIGTQTVRFERDICITASAAVGSKKEAEGPMAGCFDLLCEDSNFGETTWEKAESRMQKDAVNRALEKAAKSPADIHYIFAGDLLNQCIPPTGCGICPSPSWGPMGPAPLWRRP